MSSKPLHRPTKKVSVVRKSSSKHVVAVFYIDIGSTPPNDVVSYMEGVKNSLDICEIRKGFEKAGMSFDSMFIPSRNQPTRVEFSQFEKENNLI